MIQTYLLNPRRGIVEPAALERISMAPYDEAPRHVVDARYLGDYIVWLQFRDGRKGIVDLAGHLHGKAFERRRDKSHFAGVHLDDQLASIAWEEVWFVTGAWFVAGLLLALP
jgi:hypothetical protein